MNSKIHSNLSSDGTRICLVVRGLGHVPAFKNKKRSILDRNTGRQRTLTHGKTKRWMRDCTDSFVSQLFSAIQTIEPGIIQGRTKLSVIVSWLPLDDSRQWIPETVLTTLMVPKGEEGAEIVIEALACRPTGEEKITTKREINEKD